MDEVFIVVSQDDSGGSGRVKAVFLDEEQAEQHAQERTRAGLPCVVLPEYLWDMNGGPERGGFFMAYLKLDVFGELVEFSMKGLPSWQTRPGLETAPATPLVRARRHEPDGWKVSGTAADPFDLLAALHDIRDAIWRGEDVQGEYG